MIQLDESFPKEFDCRHNVATIELDRAFVSDRRLRSLSKADHICVARQ
jgi:hypothetical protein